MRLRMCQGLLQPRVCAGQALQLRAGDLKLLVYEALSYYNRAFAQDKLCNYAQVTLSY
jgi:hypothetical protein